MDTPTDTIAAIATAPGEAGVAIVRVSGSACLAIADSVFRCAGAKPSERPSHTIVHGHITSHHADLDEVLLLIMRAPHSYTAEDVIEIQGHGGNVAARRILRRVLDAGARLAEPGEFTMRAFLSGRIDLLQAEAVLDLVRAQSDRAASAAVEQLEGGLSRRFNNLYDELMSLTADLEASLDFPDDELPPLLLPDVLRRMEKTAADTKALSATWDEGHLLREGALVVISGRPNVGKSTLLNTLLGKERAIVSQIPGTTRDTIEEGLAMDGIPVRLVDTAGLRDPQSEVELEGIRRTRLHMEKADLHLYLIDASRPLNDDDRAQLRELTGEPCIVVLNKIDLGEAVKADHVPGLTAVSTSLVNEVGVGELREAMRRKLEAGLDMSVPPHAVVSERHRQLLVAASGDVEKAIDLVRRNTDEGVPLASSHLRAALVALGAVTGRAFNDDLLSSIFSKFCIGK